MPYSFGTITFILTITMAISFITATFIFYTTTIILNRITTVFIQLRELRDLYLREYTYSGCNHTLEIYYILIFLKSTVFMTISHS